jgi:putative transposase
LAACDFFTIELLVGRKLVRCTVFFVMELATRKVFFAPVKPQPDGDYMLQVARILTDYGDSILQGKGFLIHDRDPLYTKDFRTLLKNAGIESTKLPARSPNLNCCAERFVRSVKSECLDHLILSSVEQLEYVLEQYSEYYHHERIHQSLDRMIERKHPIDDTAEIVCIERLGGLLKSYHRLAA